MWNHNCKSDYAACDEDLVGVLTNPVFSIIIVNRKNNYKLTIK